MYYQVNATGDSAQLSSDDWNLDIPSQNSVGMKILRPNPLNAYYAGNNSGFVTLPQWFNLFSANVASGDLKTAYDIFTNGQVNKTEESGADASWKNIVGKLPVSVWVDIGNFAKEGKATGRMSPNEMPEYLTSFDIRLTNVIVKGNGSRQVNYFALTGKPGEGTRDGWTSWDKWTGNNSDWSLPNPATGTTRYVRIIWLDPEFIPENKNTIPAATTCSLEFSWQLVGSVPDSTAKVTYSLDTHSIFYKATEAFISNNISIKTIADVVKTTDTRPGGGRRT